MVKKRNPQNWKTNNSVDDAKKFELIRNESINESRGGTSDEALKLQIQQVQTVHKNFPLVRFYGFHKTAKEFAEKKFCIDNFGIIEDYYRCPRLPDGYYFDYPEKRVHPDIPWNPSIFIIEIENYSRVDESRTNDYFNWWMFFDGVEVTSLYIMEFNRFGDFQRDIFRESCDDRDSVEILKNMKQKGEIKCQKKKSISVLT